MLDRPISVSHDDWDQHWSDYTEAAERNPAQHYRRRITCQLLRQAGCSDSARILDIGSGQGDLAADLRQAFPAAQITGLELSAAGVAVSRRKVPDAQFHQRDLLAPDCDAGALRGWATYAVCSEVLEHLDDPAHLLRNAAEFLAPGCALVVTVPGGPRSEFDRHIGHRQHFTPARLRDLLVQSGFEVRIATAAGFPFFNLYRLAVIFRGRRLVTDVQTGASGLPGFLARVVMAAFRPLFYLNLTRSRLGWQTVAVAYRVGAKPPN